MSNLDLLTNGASFDEIQAEVVRTRRAQAVRNRVDALRSMRAELEVTLGSIQRRIAMGDNSAAMQVPSLIKRIEAFNVQIDAGLQRLHDHFGPLPLKPAGDEYLDSEPTKGAKRGKA